MKVRADVLSSKHVQYLTQLDLTSCYRRLMLQKLEKRSPDLANVRERVYFVPTYYTGVIECVITYSIFTLN